MEIKILGTDCPKCRKLYEEAMKAVEESGVEVTVTKVKNIQEIIESGIMKTPALVIDDEVKCCGRLPTISEIIDWIKKEPTPEG